MGETEDLGRLSEQARGDLGQFFKVTERWTENPLPSEEIIGEEEFVKLILNVPVKCTRWLVRKVVLDLDALMDPDRSRLVKKFIDSPKNGLSIEVHDSQAALVHIGRHLKLFTDNVQVDGGVTLVWDLKKPSESPSS